MAGIFDKVKLRPSQLHTVAQRRFGDAKALLDTEKNERANGAMYMAGFVIECLLKAQLLREHRWLQSSKLPESRSQSDRHLWSLCYRSHDLEEILARLPKLTRRLADLALRGRPNLLRNLQEICRAWTIFARYSPKSAMMSEAERFVERVQELKECLK